VFIPNRGCRGLVSRDLVELKPREEWTIEDVCNSIIVPLCNRDDSIYLEWCMGTGSVGAPFQGKQI
jgi:hypothetical protein